MEPWMIGAVLGVLVVVFIVVTLRQARSEDMKHSNNAPANRK